jgi:CheY-like chemotaxis protein
MDLESKGVSSMVVISKKDIIDLYRTMLEPLGYSVVEKARPKEVVEWVPVDPSIYKGMTSQDIEKALLDTRQREVALFEKQQKVQAQAAAFLEKEGPNDMTKSLFATSMTGAAKLIAYGSVQIESKELHEATNLKGYLENLRNQALLKEMTEKFKKIEPSLVSVEKISLFGPTQLKFKIK